MKKILSFAVVHFTVAFHFHEKIWNALGQSRMLRTVMA